jgi:hypothetical protein
MTLDQVRELVEARTLADLSASGNAPADALAATAARLPACSPPGSPKSAATASAAVVTAAAAASAAAAAPNPPPVALSEIGFPEVMPPRRKLEAQQFVRIVGI